MVVVQVHKLEALMEMVDLVVVVVEMLL